MPICSSERSKLLHFAPRDVPLNDEGLLIADVYVELPRNDRFIRFVLSGEALSAEHFQKIERHTCKHLFVRIDELTEQPENSSKQSHLSTSDEATSQPHQQHAPEKSSGGARRQLSKESDSGSVQVFAGEAYQGPETRRFKSTPSENLGQNHSQVFEEKDYANSRQQHLKTPPDSGMLSHFGQDASEFLKAPIASALKNIYSDLIAPDVARINLETSPIGELTDRLVNVIAPEVENLRNYLKAIPQYFTMMNDSAAITAISTLFAIARGQTSRSIFKDLSYACLFMDISLAELSVETWKTYYVQPNLLSADDARRIRTHPQRSAELVQKRFKNLPDIVVQMILGHHELFNGKGYPRGQRSEMLAPLVRILALAVDVFEFMKRAQHRGEICSLDRAVDFFLKESVEPHRRRHNLAICRDISQYLAEERAAA